VLLPLHGWRAWPRLLARLRAGAPGVRAREYAMTMALQWGLAGAALWRWLAADRPLIALGFAAPLTWRFFVVAALATAMVALLVRTIRRLSRPGRDWSRMGERLGSVLPMLPHTSLEMNLFVALSLTAGVCEEVLFRGFLLWWLAAIVGIVPGLLIATLSFGLAHAYQGRSGVVKTGIVGLVMSLLYLLGGSLWPLFALHAALDLQGGYIGWLYSRAISAAGTASREGTHAKPVAACSPAD
jgi:membrane protease YdiL (CAAX protease family)